MDKLKLNLKDVLDRDLDESKLSQIIGGAGNCSCGCLWEGKGGSSTAANDSANNAGDLHTCPDIETSKDEQDYNLNITPQSSAQDAICSGNPGGWV